MKISPTPMSIFVAAGFVGTLGFAGTVQAAQTLEAFTIDRAITLDGDMADWDGIAGTTIPLSGNGGVDSVEVKAIVNGDTIYVSVVWDDPTQDILHKPLQWDAASSAYKKTKQKEDRLAISLRMSGEFSANKVGGGAFVADVWHWKASRSNPAGVAHDKMWKVSNEPFADADEFPGPNGSTVYLARRSDQGDRLYKPVKYDAKQDDVMSRYEVNMNAQGSIVDVRAKGVWRNGRWHLELARKLNTGHADDAVIPANGTIEIAIAGFNAVDGADHSTSEKIILKTGNPAVQTSDN